MKKDNKSYIKQWLIGLGWFLYFFFSLVNGANLENCEYYEGVVYEIDDYAFTIDVKIEPSEKNTEFRRVFHCVNSSDYEIVKSKAKVGDSFILHYERASRGINILRMGVNGKTIIKYNWWKGKVVTFILAIIGFLVLFIVPIISHFYRKSRLRYKMRTKFERYVINEITFDSCPKILRQSYDVDSLLYEFKNNRYFQIFRNNKSIGVYQFGIDEISPDNAKEISGEIAINRRKYADRLCNSNELFEEMEKQLIVELT